MVSPDTRPPCAPSRDQQVPCPVRGRPAARRSPRGPEPKRIVSRYAHVQRRPQSPSMSLPTASCTISSRRGRGPPCRVARPARSRLESVGRLSSRAGLARHRRLQLRHAGSRSEGRTSELRASLDEICGAAHGIIGEEQKMAENREQKGSSAFAPSSTSRTQPAGACPRQNYRQEGVRLLRQVL